MNLGLDEVMMSDEILTLKSYIAYLRKQLEPSTIYNNLQHFLKLTVKHFWGDIYPIYFSYSLLNDSIGFCLLALMDGIKDEMKAIAIEKPVHIKEW